MVNYEQGKDGQAISRQASEQEPYMMVPKKEWQMLKKD